MKTCFKCGETKPVSHFYRHPAMGDGRLGKCKLCTRKDSAARIARMKLDPAWVESERKRSRDKRHRYPSNPGPQSAARSKWILRNPLKVRVQRIAANAAKRGVLVKPDCCQRCGEPARRLEKHHEDYSKPLEVEWLCPKCHGLTKRKSIAL